MNSSAQSCSPPRAGAVIIGSGPSLASVDMRRLCDRPSIAFNRAYVAYSRWGFAPRYYSCIDRFLLPSIIREIQDLADSGLVERLFIRDTAVEMGLAPNSRVQLVHVTEEPQFSTDFSSLGMFYNVAAISVQILAALGYKRLLLVGVDGKYCTHPGAKQLDHPDHLEAITGNDPNHFCTEYLSPGLRFSRPRPDRFIRGWRLLATQLSAAHVEVRNATVGSAVDSFPTTELDGGLRWLEAA
jgi:hypothetical protein